MNEITPKQVDDLYLKIESSIRRTPLLRSFALERRLNSRFPIFLKAENLQFTGSFKARGAISKLLSLSEAERKKGVIAASAGNHAQGVAYHCSKLGISAKIVMPVASPHIKIFSTKQWGAEIVLSGESYQESYEHALKLKEQEGRVLIHAFDDIEIIKGQATIAKEIAEEFPEVASFICPIGGGGLMAGCATYLKNFNPKLKAYGVQAEGCSTFLPSLSAGAPVTLKAGSTIAEGMSAKRMGDITFELCKKYVDRGVTVSDEEIAEGLLWILENERLFVEGCGGSTVAAALRYPEMISGPTVILLSGGNLDVNFLARIIEKGLVKAGRLVHWEFQIPDAPGTLHRLLNIFAETRASIVHVSHERVFGKASLREVLVTVVLETQGSDHNAEIERHLASKGWKFVRIS